MWLAETAVDYDTLEALVAENIKFIVLAPSQAQRCRPIPTEDDSDSQWHEVGGNQIDPTLPYRCYLNVDKSTKKSTPYIDIFFYDGPISRDMALVMWSTIPIILRDGLERRFVGIIVSPN